MSTAKVIINSALLVIEKSQMIRALQEERAFSNRFIHYMLSRNIRVQEDLIDQLSIRARKDWRALSCC